MREKLCFCSIICIMITLFLLGCAGLEKKDTSSDMTGGLSRVVTVYDDSGNQIAVYEGKMILEEK